MFLGRWGKNDTDVQHWKILSDTEHVTETDFTIPDPPSLNVDMSMPLDDMFFEYFLPDVTGHALKLDKYLSNLKAEWHTTYVGRGFKFHDPTNPDPDWKVKQGFLILVAGATEFHNGVDNLWKSGQGKGRHFYPDYGQYMDRDEFRCFMSAAVYCFTEERYWFVDKRDMTWNTFQPFVDAYNAQRKALFKEPPKAVVVNESMIEWKSKMLETGGLPNATHEPRKPKDYGTMTHDGAEIVSGITVGHEIVEVPEKMRSKKYFGAPISFYDKRDTTAYAAVTLRMADMFGIPQGGWVCGDAWFGSIITAVELRKKLGIHSTFIIKNNDFWFPRKPLLDVLFARHGDRVAGHHVVMTTEIAGVKLFAMAYAWSAKGVCFVLSTCGTTVISENPYYSKFEDANGVATRKPLPRPRVLEVLFTYLPVIDEFNKEAQNTLNILQSWPTQCCWTRLLLAFIGYCVVDQHRACMLEEPFEYRNVGVLDFADMMSKDMKIRNRVNHSSPSVGLRRITGGETDSPHKTLSRGLAQKGRVFGKGRERSCFMCRKYSDHPSFTLWECGHCRTALCSVDCTGVDGRTMSCKSEHDHSTEANLRCNGHRKPAVFPARYKLYRQGASGCQILQESMMHQQLPSPVPPQPPMCPTTPHYPSTSNNEALHPSQQYYQYPQYPSEQQQDPYYFNACHPVTNPTPIQGQPWTPSSYMQTHNQYHSQFESQSTPSLSPAKKVARTDNAEELYSEGSEEDL